MSKNYKKKYRILLKGVTEIIRTLKKDVYNEKISPTALRYMSDLKYYILLSFYCEKEEKKAQKMIEKNHKNHRQAIH